MKRKVFLATVCFVFIIFLCSCDSNNKIKSIKVDDNMYSTFYLYSFEDAKVNTKYSNLNDSYQAPTTTGYKYSSEKLSVGDVVKVWTNFYFEEGNEYYNTSSFGTNAVVKEVLGTYRVTVEEKSDTYIITYYDYENKTFSDKASISEIQKHKIEVVKERVTIEYE